MLFETHYTYNATAKFIEPNENTHMEKIQKQKNQYIKFNSLTCTNIWYREETAMCVQRFLVPQLLVHNMQMPWSKTESHYKIEKRHAIINQANWLRYGVPF